MFSYGIWRIGCFADSSSTSPFVDVVGVSDEELDSVPLQPTSISMGALSLTCARFHTLFRLVTCIFIRDYYEAIYRNRSCTLYIHNILLKTNLH